MIDRIRETVARYLSGAIDADDLAAQMPDPWEMDQHGADETARRLALRVIGYVTEFQNGDSTERALRDRLRLTLPANPTVWSATRRSEQVTGTAVRAASEFKRQVLVG